jgi:hypothetical protein
VSVNLFFRDGTPFTGTPFDADKAPYTIVHTMCSRCGGAGRSDRWAHTGYVCYQCNGSKHGPDKRERLYTAEKLAALNATRDKNRAVKAAKTAAAQMIVEAETAARRAAFDDQHRPLLAWLAEVALVEGYDDQRVYKEGFLGDMLRRADQLADWSEAQVTALQASYDRRRALVRQRAASRWVGIVGERLRAAVTVEREFAFERKRMMGGWGADAYETVYITTLRDADGNTLVVKSPRFRAAIGSQITVTGTIKAHDEYKGEQQTTLQRVRIAPESV